MAAIIPLRDASRRPARFPWVTAAIIALNVLVFVLELSGGDEFIMRWALIPANVAAGHPLVTIVTALFMHGSWLHAVSNMVFLWAFGPEIEDLMGPRRYLIFYLAGGLTATLTQVAAVSSSTVPMLGASGAIAAVIGAFIVTYPRDRIRSLLIIFVFVSVTYIPAVLLIGIWFLMQFLSLGAVTPEAGGVAYAAHVGGVHFRGSVRAAVREIAVIYPTADLWSGAAREIDIARLSHREIVRTQWRRCVPKLVCGQTSPLKPSIWRRWIHDG